MSENSAHSDEKPISDVQKIFFTMKKKQLLFREKKERHFFPLGIYFIEVREKNI